MGVKSGLKGVKRGLMGSKGDKRAQIVVKMGQNGSKKVLKGQKGLNSGLKGSMYQHVLACLDPFGLWMRRRRRNLKLRKMKEKKKRLDKEALCERLKSATNWYLHFTKKS